MYRDPIRRTTPEKFYIEANDDGCVDVLAVDRVSTEMTLTGKSRVSFSVRRGIVTRIKPRLPRFFSREIFIECFIRVIF